MTTNHDTQASASVPVTDVSRRAADHAADDSRPGKVNVAWLVVGLIGLVGFVLLMLAAVTAGSEGVKQLTLRPRPETGTASGIPGVVYSYPSGHALEALTILGFVAIRVWRTAWALAVRLAVAILVVVDIVLVGIARMALGAHYPTDVLAGVLAGLGVLGLYAWFMRRGAWADKPPADSGEASKGS